MQETIATEIDVLSKILKFLIDEESITLTLAKFLLLILEIY